MVPPKKSKKTEPKYETGERVFCFDLKSQRHYEAKVLDVNDEVDEDKPYKIHYQGWNTRHDEWVEDKRILEFNDENKKKIEIDAAATAGVEDKKIKKIKSGAKKTKSELGDEDKKTESGSRASTPSVDTTPKLPKSSRASAASDSIGTPTTVTTSAADRRKRASVARPEPHVESAAEHQRRPEIRFTIPEDLKKLLVDDHDLVTRQYKLVRFPARVTAEEIFEEYKKSKADQKNLAEVKRSILVESCLGIRDYFNAALGIQLLYKIERPQYSDWYEKNTKTKPSEIYGFIHLLRLFVRFGSILAFTPWSENSIRMLQTQIHDFLGFMQQNKTKFYNLDEDYETTTPNYQRRAFET